MQYILTAEEMEKYVKRSDLVHSELVREKLFRFCQPKVCIYLSGGKHRKCDNCDLKGTTTVFDESNKPHKLKLCPLEQYFSK